MKALGEKPMFSDTLSKGTDVYRFTWLRTFHRPVAFRLEVRDDGTGTFYIKVADGAGGYEPGKLVRDEVRKLDKRTTEMLAVRFDVAKFHELPTKDENGGLDGSQWILEAILDGKYHVVERWSPKAGPVHAIGMEFIELAIGGDFTPIY